MRLLRCPGQSLKALVVGACAVLLLADSDHLGAQTTDPAVSGFPGFSASPNDQVRPRLILGSKGEVYRLSERKADERPGGRAVAGAADVLRDSALSDQPMSRTLAILSVLSATLRERSAWLEDPELRGVQIDVKVNGATVPCASCCSSRNTR